MKLKEVCQKTGLSRKTIRLYEEKGLIVPRKEQRNGREYREYTEIDLQMLKTIALLRRAWFTMDEIRRMQEDSESIEVIFLNYRQWLQKQKQDLDILIAVAERVEPEKVETIGQLTEQMAVAASRLPLPKYDVMPHFLYLDKMEEGIKPMKDKKVKENWQAPLEDGMSDSRIYRQFVASSSKIKSDDLAVAFGQAQDAMEMIREDKHGLVQEEPIGDAPAMTAGKIITFLLAAFFGVTAYILGNLGADRTPVTVLWVLFAVMAALRIGLGALARSIRKEKKRMREAEKR